MNRPTILKKIRDRVRTIPPADAGHDFSHIERVAVDAVRLIRAEVSGDFVRWESNAECAALLHDCVPVPKNSPLRAESARLCAEKAAVWLTEWGWPTEDLVLVIEAIEDHSYSSGRLPRSLVGKCLQDADRLEALGAIGLYRTIATGVSMGARLFDPDDPWAGKRSLDDHAYTIDHFFKKLLKLPSTFHTESGRQEAKRRADYLIGFLNQLGTELSNHPAVWNEADRTMSIGETPGFPSGGSPRK